MMQSLLNGAVSAKNNDLKAHKESDKIDSAANNFSKSKLTEEQNSFSKVLKENIKQDNVATDTKANNKINTKDQNNAIQKAANKSEMNSLNGASESSDVKAKNSVISDSANHNKAPSGGIKTNVTTNKSVAIDSNITSNTAETKPMLGLLQKNNAGDAIKVTTSEMQQELGQKILSPSTDVESLQQPSLANSANINYSALTGQQNNSEQVMASGDSDAQTDADQEINNTQNQQLLLAIQSAQQVNTKVNVSNNEVTGESAAEFDINNQLMYLDGSEATLNTTDINPKIESADASDMLTSEDIAEVAALATNVMTAQNTQQQNMINNAGVNTADFVAGEQVVTGAQGQNELNTSNSNNAVNNNVVMSNGTKSTIDEINITNQLASTEGSSLSDNTLSANPLPANSLSANSTDSNELQTEKVDPIISALTKDNTQQSKLITTPATSMPETIGAENVVEPLTAANNSQALKVADSLGQSVDEQEPVTIETINSTNAQLTEDIPVDVVNVNATKNTAVNSTINKESIDNNIEQQKITTKAANTSNSALNTGGDGSNNEKNDQSSSLKPMAASNQSQPIAANVSGTTPESETDPASIEAALQALKKSEQDDSAGSPIRHESTAAAQTVTDVNGARPNQTSLAQLDKLMAGNQQQQATNNLLQQPLDIQSKQAAAMMGERVMMMISQGKQEVQIRLDPAELGSMFIKVNIQQDQLQLNIQTQAGLSKDIIEQNMPRLREQLAQQGIQLGEANVQQQSQQQGQQQQNNGMNAMSGRQTHNNGMVEEEQTAVWMPSKVASTDQGIDFYA
ncbi:flagellar hook-length control protein FliK [uncultured Psychromonas sp.]|uniref:flagellar hook-length control protein FliK n=1 Tax=uncultured Psychromonas sp. TaxID=173974 RepID=UPI00262C86C0|nr:flagellar hook-length control protein FliK [uncultured Psychromonas sp.]